MKDSSSPLHLLSPSSQHPRGSPNRRMIKRPTRRNLSVSVPDSPVRKVRFKVDQGQRKSLMSDLENNISDVKAFRKPDLGFEEISY